MTRDGLVTRSPCPREGPEGQRQPWLTEGTHTGPKPSLRPPPPPSYPEPPEDTRWTPATRKDSSAVASGAAPSFRAPERCDQGQQPRASVTRHEQKPGQHARGAALRPGSASETQGSAVLGTRMGLQRPGPTPMRALLPGTTRACQAPNEHGQNEQQQGHREARGVVTSDREHVSS